MRLRSVKAAIWQNQTREGGVFYSVTFARSYRDQQGNWHDTHSFGGTEALLLAELARMAFHWIAETVQRANQQQGGDSASEIPF